MMSLRKQVNRSKLVGYSLLFDNLNLQGIWKKLLFELTVGSLPASRLFLEGARIRHKRSAVVEPKMSGTRFVLREIHYFAVTIYGNDDMTSFFYFYKLSSSFLKIHCTKPKCELDKFLKLRRGKPTCKTDPQNHFVTLWFESFPVHQGSPKCERTLDYDLWTLTS